MVFFCWLCDRIEGCVLQLSIVLVIAFKVLFVVACEE